MINHEQLLLDAIMSPVTKPAPEGRQPCGRGRNAVLLATCALWRMMLCKWNSAHCRQHSRDNPRGLTMIQITIDMKVRDVMRLPVLVVAANEGRQSFIEEPLDQLHVVTHLWEVATQAEVTLQCQGMPR